VISGAAERAEKAGKEYYMSQKDFNIPNLLSAFHDHQIVSLLCYLLTNYKLLQGPIPVIRPKEKEKGYLQVMDKGSTRALINTAILQVRESQIGRYISMVLDIADMLFSLMVFSTLEWVTELLYCSYGMRICKKELVKRLALGVMFTDPLARMYLATVARERVAGASKALHAKYLSKMKQCLKKVDYECLLDVLREAVKDLNAIAVVNRQKCRRLETYVNHYLSQSDQVMRQFRFYRRNLPYCLCSTIWLCLQPYHIVAAREEMDCGAGVVVSGQMARPFFVSRIWPKYLANFDNHVSLEIEKWKSWVSGLGLWKRASNFVRK